MASPTITGFSPLLTKANFASSVILTNVTSPTLSIVGEQLRTDNNAGGGVPYSYVEIPVEGGPLDLSAAVIECLVSQNWGAGRGFSIGLSSGPNANENWKVWRCPGALTNRRVQYFIDPSSTSFYLSGGTFDPTDVRRFRYQWDGNQSERNVIFTDEPIWIPKNPGLIAVGGDGANPITAEVFGNFLSLLTAESGYHSNTIEVTSRQGFGNYQALPLGCSIGDGTNPQVTSFDSAVFRTPDTTDVSGGTSQPTVAISSTNRRVNTSSVESFSAFQVIGLSAGDGFQDVSPVNNDYSNFFARNLGVINLGQGDYQGRISQALGSVTEGRNLALNFNGSTAQYTYIWNGVANLSGSVFDSPLSQYAIDIEGANFTDGATFDASEITFTQNPSVRKFRLNAAGKTLNLAVGTSGITVADVDIVAGTIVIQTPQATLQLVGIPNVANAIVYVKNLTTDQVTFPTITNGEANISVDTAAQYEIRADAPGYLASPLFTVPGTVTRFEFNLENQRALYDTGVNRSAQIAFNLSTFEITIGDSADLVFADVFRTLEDYLSTQEGILFLGHPRPVSVSLGNGVRNYLFFPPIAGQVNPVRIKPNSLNVTDPTFTDFVIILQEATAPLFDIFDFVSAGGRIIRFQTDSVVANVTGGSGGGATAAEIYTYFTAGVRPDPFKATGFSTHSAADIWAVATRTLTAIDKTGYSLSPVERAALAVEIEAALLNEGDGQPLIDAIVTLINTNLDLPLLELAAIASQVRSELAPELARMDVNISSRLATAAYTPPLDAASTQAAVGSALTAYDPPTRGELTADKNEILTTITPASFYTHFVTNGLSTHSPADVWSIPSRTLTAIDKTGYSLSPAERSTLTTQIEAALINDGDGQALIDAIVTLINTNLDLPLLELAAIANQVRAELTPELTRIQSIPLNPVLDTDYVPPLNTPQTQAAVANALVAYDPPTRAELTTDKNEILTTITPANIYTHFLTNGLSTHSAADVWAITTRTLTAIDKTGYSLSAAERSALAVQIEAALLDDGDGQALIDAIVLLINTNLDLPPLELAAIANQVRLVLAPELALIDAPISGALTSFAGLPPVTVSGYALGQSPSEQVDLSGIALESTSQTVLTRVNALPTLTQMEASTALTSIPNLDGVNSSLDAIQIALASVALDARAAKNLSAAGL